MKTLLLTLVASAIAVAGAALVLTPPSAEPLTAEPQDRGYYLETQGQEKPQLYIGDLLLGSDSRIIKLAENDDVAIGVEAHPAFRRDGSVIGMMVQVIRKAANDLPVGTRMYSFIKMDCQKNEAVLITLTMYAPDGKLLSNMNLDPALVNDPKYVIKYNSGTFFDAIKRHYCGQGLPNGDSPKPSGPRRDA